MRRRTNKLTVSLALLAVTLLSPASLTAQVSKGASTDDWSALKSVATGDKLNVKLKNGKSVSGKLSSVSETSLSLLVKNKVTDLKRDDVLSVYQTTRKSATKATLIGMGVGAGAGAGIGVAASSNDNSGFEKIDHAATAGLTVIGAGVGAVAGYLIGRSGRKQVLIYQASHP
jgi:hypothetical protein